MNKKDLIKKVSIKEEFVSIANTYVDLGKVIYVDVNADFFIIKFCFMFGKFLEFENPWKSTDEHYISCEDPTILKKEEFDTLLSFVKQRFGGKEITSE